MAIITFTSDLGNRDHYVPAIKAKMLTAAPNVNIVDITHQINQGDIPHAAFVLGAVFRDFPQGTVHLVALNAQGQTEQKLVALKLEEHYFVGPDNGIFSLMSEKNPSLIVELYNDPTLAGKSPEKNILTVTAVSLAKGRALSDIGKQLVQIEKPTKQTLKKSKNQIEGRVVYIDTFGNLITNIKQEDVAEIGNSRQVRVRIGRHEIENISTSYLKRDSGDCVCIFNSLDLLEISIIHGNASNLLGMKYDSRIVLQFSPTLE
jgi:S-adenosyl-L-methionine hydrolase (adenosine-forming)